MTEKIVNSGRGSRWGKPIVYANLDAVRAAWRPIEDVNRSVAPGFGNLGLRLATDHRALYVFEEKGGWGVTANIGDGHIVLVEGPILTKEGAKELAHVWALRAGLLFVVGAIPNEPTKDVG